MNWYPIFLREILLFRRRLLRLGYVVSAMFAPLLYLLAFGLGLGKRVTIPGVSYLDYLLPGLIAMSSMTNSYTWVANGLTVGRLHFHTFQIYIQAPVTPAAIVWGQVLAGMVRGLFASLIILGLGLLLGSGLRLNIIFVLALLLNCLVFAAFGVVVGMQSRSHEDTATFTNFFIMPMAFFCGTFFPVEEMPWILQGIIRSLPLTHTNRLLRTPGWTVESLGSLVLLAAFGLCCLVLGTIIIRRYSE
ncbi:MAG: ABC transporter permease [Deltaproteobacteria bacterium]|nr:ABC transporter permease [Deltaproteobacteria bacterium]MBW1953814.1 ABC transporter permease [Deltaproteobacteria bacterium]